MSTFSEVRSTTIAGADREPMKLCFIAAANSVHSYRWIKFFAEKGCRVTWISLAKNTVGTIDGVEQHILSNPGSSPLGMVRAAFETRKIVRQVQPDVVHAHYVGKYGLLGTLSGFHPLVLTAWGSDVLMTTRLTRPVVRRVLRVADLITCDAHHLHRAVTGLGAQSDKVRIIIFGTDPERFYPARRSHQVREAWGFGGRPVVLSLRSLEPVYDIETFIHAMPTVLQACPEAAFVIAGGGSLASRLQEQVKELGLEGHVCFTGPLAGAKVPETLASADVYVSTSLSDGGLAASTAEAMACGTPVVITDSGENDLWVQDGSNGLLVPVRQPEALAAGIIKLLRDEELRNRMAYEGRATILEKCSYLREMEKMFTLYRELAGRVPKSERVSPCVQKC
jgi:glycosyltransferase involved in cell wall biosynthesis